MSTMPTRTWKARGDNNFLPSGFANVDGTVGSTTVQILIQCQAGINHRQYRSC
jgi:hypothetical protein